jgi:hypothetical protein
VARDCRLIPPQNWPSSTASSCANVQWRHLRRYLPLNFSTGRAICIPGGPLLANNRSYSTLRIPGINPILIHSSVPRRITEWGKRGEGEKARVLISYICRSVYIICDLIRENGKKKLPSQPSFRQGSLNPQFPFMYSQKRFSEASLLIPTKYFQNRITVYCSVWNYDILERSTVLQYI